MAKDHRQYFTIKSIAPAPLRGFVLSCDLEGHTPIIRRIPIVAVAIVEKIEMVRDAEKGKFCNEQFARPDLTALAREGWRIVSTTELIEPVVLVDQMNFPWPRMALAREQYDVESDVNPVVWCEGTPEEVEWVLSEAERICTVGTRSRNKTWDAAG